MSLESALYALAEAINAHAAAMSSQAGVDTPDSTQDTTDTKPKRTRKSRAAKESPADAPAPAPEAEAPAPAPAAEAPAPVPAAEAPAPAPKQVAVSLDTVKSKVMEVANGLGRDHAVKLLSAYNAKKVGDVAEHDYADIVGDADRMLATEAA